MKSRVGRAPPAARPLDFGLWTLDFSKKLLMSHGLSQNHEKPGGTGVLTCAFSRVPKKVLMVGPSLRKLSQAVPDGPQAHPQSMTRPSVGRAKGRRLPHPPPQKNPATPTRSLPPPRDPDLGRVLPLKTKRARRPFSASFPGVRRCIMPGGDDETRTRDLRRDRPAF
jgi:hypothetical protein